MKTNRTAWITSLATLGAVTIAVAAYSPWSRSPDPRTADCQELFRWLVQRDLATEPTKTQLAWVDRFAEEFQSGMETPEGRSQLSESRAARLSANIELLERVWFAARVDRLFEIAPGDRAEFLDEQIATLFRWCDLETPDLEPAVVPKDKVGAFFAHVERWIDEAVPPAKERMRGAVRLGVARWLTVGDLAGCSRKTRSLLADRIARELDRGLAPSSVLADLNQPQRTTLQANAELLLEAWFLDRADEYFSTAADEKNVFLDAQIEKLGRWRIDTVLAPNESGGPAQPRGKLARMIRWTAMVQTWIDRAPPERQQRLRELATATQLRMLRGGSHKG